ncbi:MAG: DUF262 domain-containing HNH endonuclease family protein [Hyphomonadaceae bacterium]|nr:DUF262 domain-containing HNH endonuclease family protein [Hyphomonadaceae bacterium]
MDGDFGGPPHGLSSDILNIAAVLTRKAPLKVPRYQRPYTWTEREVRVLIEDLTRAHKRTAPFYFIGQIVLVRNGGRFEISDGQQRLATLTMIFAYARDRLSDHAALFQGLIMEGGEPRLLLRDQDAPFYRHFVQEPGRLAALGRQGESSIESQELIASASRAIDAELSDLTAEELLDFLTYVARCCTLNVVDAEERGCAQTVFNTQNKGGSPLSGADMIKSDLLENAGLSDNEADAAALRWEQIEDMFERENFARLLYMLPYLLNGQPMLSTGDMGAFRAEVERTGGVRAFLFDHLPRYAEALRSIFNGSVDAGPASADVNRRIHLLRQVESWDWAPAALAFLANYDGDHESARRFFEGLDRFTFACELSVVDVRVQQRRFSAAVTYCRDEKGLFGQEGVLNFSEAEHTKFIDTLNKSRKRDRMRRLLLIRLEAAMPGGRLLSITDDVTVEHILPRANVPWWAQRFPNPKARLEFANLLGNLTLVSLAQNTAADTKPFPEKRRIYFHTKGAPVFALTRDFEGEMDWTEQVIEARHQRLVRTLCEDWGVSCDWASKAA